jgi:hypothetical protein
MGSSEKNFPEFIGTRAARENEKRKRFSQPNHQLVAFLPPLHGHEK